MEDQEATHRCYLFDRSQVHRFSLCHTRGSDAKWAQREFARLETWKEVKREFIAHFQHPNIVAVWQNQIRNLKANAGEIQKYSDKFVDLAIKLGWNFEEPTTLWQYKSGLPVAIRAQISGLSSVGRRHLVLRDLIEMALSVEADLNLDVDWKKMNATISSEVKSDRKKYSIDLKEKKCYYCGKTGHIAENCMKKKREKFLKEGKDKKEDESKESKNKDSKPKCYKCGKPGHYANECTEEKKKKARQVSTQEEQENNKNEVTTPCRLNGIDVTALVDGGATTSFISLDFVKRHKLDIRPKNGIIAQALDNCRMKRIGIVKDAILENGARALPVTLEVAILADNIELIIGMDLFEKLGYELRGVPFTVPSKPAESSEAKEETTADGEIYESWKKVLEDNQKLGPKSICKLSGTELPVPTGDAKPIWIRQYDLPQALHSKITERVNLWKANGWVTLAPEESGWNFPLWAAPKLSKDGGPDDIRLCIDARELNKVIVSDQDNDLPHMRGIIDRLGKFDLITMLDMEDSYQQFPIKKEDQQKVSFTWNGEHLMFATVPFGLKVMTGHMQRIMEKLLGGLGRLPFLDDVAVASKADNHEKEVLEVLEKITYEAGLRLRLKKCKFAQTKVVVLGYEVSKEGIRMNPKKVKAILSWEYPENGKAMQRFLGAVNFHREFSKDFAEFMAPLDELRNHKRIHGTKELKIAFNKLKELFAQNVLLRHVDWDKEMYLSTDASNSGIGAWLGQKDEHDQLVPIICVSKKLNLTQRKWGATKRELYALMWGMNKLRMYLQGRHFVARVDHRPLVTMSTKKPNSLTDRWMEAILSFDYETVYVPGKTHDLADALSRSFHLEKPERKIRTITSENLTSEEWAALKRGKELPGLERRKELMEKCHAEGHFSVNTLFRKLFVDYKVWWRGMRKDLENLVLSCETCLRVDIKNMGYHPARSIEANRLWDHVEMDLIGPVPMSVDGYQFILTIVDVFTGYTILRPLKTKQQEEVAQALWLVMTEYGTMKILQSDNGKEFVNQVMKQLMKLYGVDRRTITPFHPSANGLVERKNKEVERLLKKLMGGVSEKWETWLSLVQLYLNMAINSRTNSAPFTLMYGRNCNGFEDFQNVMVKEEYTEEDIGIKALNFIVTAVLHKLD